VEDRLRGVLELDAPPLELSNSLERTTQEVVAARA